MHREARSSKELSVDQRILFGINILFSFVVWGFVVFAYVWPTLRARTRVEALRPVLVLHSFRFVGLAFLIPGVVSPELPSSFAGPAAYGDLTTATLALLSIAMLRRRLGIVLVWGFNVVGTGDLLHAFYEGNRIGLVPGMQGAAYFIPTLFVPLLLITHGLVFRLLLRKDPIVASDRNRRVA
jgi:hypothetical protein